MAAPSWRSVDSSISRTAARKAGTRVSGRVRMRHVAPSAASSKPASVSGPRARSIAAAIPVARSEEKRSNPSRDSSTTSTPSRTISFLTTPSARREPCHCWSAVCRPPATWCWSVRMARLGLTWTRRSARWVGLRARRSTISRMPQGAPCICSTFRKASALLLALLLGDLQALPARLVHGRGDGLVLLHPLVLHVVLDLLVDELPRFVAVPFLAFLGHAGGTRALEGWLFWPGRPWPRGTAARRGPPRGPS